VRANNVFLPHLRAHGEPAHILNTSSMAGLLALGPAMVGGFNNGLYTTTKHALIGYCDMLRMELAPEGIGVSVLCPGLVAGNLSATSARNRPARFGGPAVNPREGAAPNPAAMPADQVGPIVARAIAANRFYVFTHDDPSMVEARHAQVLADFAFLAEGASPPS
jgi:NAD(P)-dependent dehydrogenase (short-subunit alcohol dehydrogenase family)